VAHDQHAILRRHDVGLDGVHTHGEGELIGGPTVLRSITGCSAVADDER
jgi:hypothetical protein